MKMAVAKPEEVERAMTLAGILDDVDEGQFPRSAKGEFLDGDPDHFDEDDLEHLQAFYERVRGCGGLWRVVLGYAVLVDPQNKIVDPDKSYLDRHPRSIEALKAVESPAASVIFWLKRLWQYIEAVKTAWVEPAAEAVQP